VGSLESTFQTAVASGHVSAYLINFLVSKIGDGTVG